MSGAWSSPRALWRTTRHPGESSSSSDEDDGEDGDVPDDESQDADEEEADVRRNAADGSVASASGSASPRWLTSSSGVNDAYCAVGEDSQCLLVNSARTRVGGVQFPCETVVAVVNVDDAWYVCTRTHGGTYTAWRRYHGVEDRRDRRFVRLAPSDSPVVRHSVSEVLARDEAFSLSSCDQFIMSTTSGTVLERTVSDAFGNRVLERVDLDSGEVISTIKLQASVRFAVTSTGRGVAQDVAGRISCIEADADPALLSHGRIVGPIVQSANGEVLAFITDRQELWRVDATSARSAAVPAAIASRRLMLDHFLESGDSVLVRSVGSGEAWVVSF